MSLSWGVASEGLRWVGGLMLLTLFKFLFPAMSTFLDLTPPISVFEFEFYERRRGYRSFDHSRRLQSYSILIIFSNFPRAQNPLSSSHFHFHPLIQASTLITLILKKTNNIRAPTKLLFLQKLWHQSPPLHAWERRR